MKRVAVILITTMVSFSIFADSERIPAVYPSPAELKQEISRLKSEAVGKDGKPNRDKLRQLAEKENQLNELNYKSSRK